MARCETCGNDYDKAFEIYCSGRISFFRQLRVCAIQAMAPECAHCGCKVIGHGVEAKVSFTAAPTARIKKEYAKSPTEARNRHKDQCSAGWDMRDLLFCLSTVAFFGWINR
jgi:hypothetical protein